MKLKTFSLFGTRKASLDRILAGAAEAGFRAQDLDRRDGRVTIKNGRAVVQLDVVLRATPRRTDRDIKAAYQEGRFAEMSLRDAGDL